MGVRNLNKLFKLKSANGIIPISVEHLPKNITLVVDTSIYIYKGMEDNQNYIEYIYNLINMFKNQTLLFIFDGKPSADKRLLLEHRKTLKREAEQQYLSSISTTSKKQLKQLQNQFLHINGEHVDKVKTLLQSFSIEYIEAEEEADKVCAEYVLSGNAWAVISEDMDMFLYGCTRVIRNVDTFIHTLSVYHTSVILENLNVSQNELLDLAILSGTDYNMLSNSNPDLLFDLYNHYIEYKKTKIETTVWEWAQQEEKQMIMAVNTESELEYIRTKFLVKPPIIENIDNKIQPLKPVKWFQVMDVLQRNGFIFLQK